MKFLTPTPDSDYLVFPTPDSRLFATKKPQTPNSFGATFSSEWKKNPEKVVKNGSLESVKFNRLPTPDSFPPKSSDSRLPTPDSDSQALVNNGFCLKI